MCICSKPSTIQDAPRTLPIEPDKHPSISTIFLDALSIRIAVFVEEQQVPAENELDDDDKRAHHVVLYLQSGDQLMGDPPGVHVCTLRFTVEIPNEHDIKHCRETPGPDGAKSFESGAQPLLEPIHCPSDLWDGKEPYVRLGRMATLQGYRGKGLARKLLEWTLYSILNNWDMPLQLRPTLVLVHAQKDVQRFYAQSGFVVDKSMGLWVEEGIEHVGMWKRMKEDGDISPEKDGGMRLHSLE